MIQAIPLVDRSEKQNVNMPRIALRELISLDGEVDTVVTTLDYFIGRAADCDYVVNCTFASRHHCVLKTDGDRVVVRDLGSRNGTFVNRARVDGETELHSGDTLVVGLQVYEIQIGTPSTTCDGTTVPPLEQPRGLHAVGALHGE
ncbi:MAG: FHA domain-containing protein [Planctomycetota bacterium]|nr:MAG: FHA domain-containing protein [Planctomycetota bacterium]REK46728.1 MAG: FHA domain-containing protein [Planctomycetota bacterium]